MRIFYDMQPGMYGLEVLKNVIREDAERTAGHAKGHPAALGGRADVGARRVGHDR